MDQATYLTLDKLAPARRQAPICPKMSSITLVLAQASLYMTILWSQFVLAESLPESKYIHTPGSLMIVYAATIALVSLCMPIK